MNLFSDSYVSFDLYEVYWVLKPGTNDEDPQQDEYRSSLKRDMQTSIEQPTNGHFFQDRRLRFLFANLQLLTHITAIMLRTHASVSSRNIVRRGVEAKGGDRRKTSENLKSVNLQNARGSFSFNQQFNNNLSSLTHCCLFKVASPTGLAWPGLQLHSAQLVAHLCLIGNTYDQWKWATAMEISFGFCGRLLRPNSCNLSLLDEPWRSPGGICQPSVSLLTPLGRL